MINIKKQQSGQKKMQFFVMLHKLSNEISNSEQEWLQIKNRINVY